LLISFYFESPVLLSVSLQSCRSGCLLPSYLAPSSCVMQLLCWANFYPRLIASDLQEYIDQQALYLLPFSLSLSISPSLLFSPYPPTALLRPDTLLPFHFESSVPSSAVSSVCLPASLHPALLPSNTAPLPCWAWILSCFDHYPPASSLSATECCDIQIYTVKCKCTPASA